MKRMFLFFFLIFILNFSLFAFSANNDFKEESGTFQSNSFHADGFIEDKEYDNQISYQNLEIFWSRDDDSIYVALRAQASGYVTIGIQPGLMMKEADIILGYIKEGKVEIFDQYSTGNFGPHPSDTEIGGTDDILEFGGKEENGHTTIEFKRLLRTEDLYDHELVSGKNRIIWAYSNRDDKDGRHSVRGYGEIEIK